jgi:DNA-binding transcriptional ArsR family regulator
LESDPAPSDRSRADDIATGAALNTRQGGGEQTVSPETVMLNNPVALRAIAHPARQRLLSELFAGNVLTATEAAEMVGLTPSAVSHHLRALAKYGLAERAEATTDGRERPWRATGSDFNLAIPRGSASVRALQMVTRTSIASAAGELDALLEGKAGEPWTGHRGISRQVLWLNRKETKDFGDALGALIERFTAGRHSGNHPSDTRRTALTVMFLPLDPAHDSQPDPGDPVDTAHPAVRAGPKDPLDLADPADSADAVDRLDPADRWTVSEGNRTERPGAVRGR